MPAPDRDAEQVAAFAAQRLPLAGSRLCEDYYYQSLTLCVINAVFSINARYTAVQNVVQRYSEAYGLRRVRPDWTRLPATDEQESVAELCKKCAELEAERLADTVFRNRQRTSARGGILKADAVCRFAAALATHGINYLQDVPRAMASEALERDIRAIPGQRSGLSLTYLWMLAGSDDLIKPDRMILRFLGRALGRAVEPAEAQGLLAGATALLKSAHPHLTPRLLDYEVWKVESGTEGDE